MSEHEHEWTVWEKQDSALVYRTKNQEVAVRVVMENMVKRYAGCSCGVKITVSET